MVFVVLHASRSTLSSASARTTDRDHRLCSIVSSTTPRSSQRTVFVILYSKHANCLVKRQKFFRSIIFGHTMSVHETSLRSSFQTDLRQ
jgi:hypothetical protein